MKSHNSVNIDSLSIISEKKLIIWTFLLSTYLKDIFQIYLLSLHFFIEPVLHEVQKIE